ncbi:MAG: type II secretion system F family protein, partial [Fibrobacteres bacterium]|nr:type II secretion system F family protein [Fibrobacterota bacterium]
MQILAAVLIFIALLLFCYTAYPFIIKLSKRYSAFVTALSAKEAQFHFTSSRFPLALFFSKANRRKRAAKLELQLPEVAQRLADAVRAGAGLKEALEESALRCGAPFSDEAYHALRETELGISLVDALSRLAERIGSPEYTTLCTAISVSQETGGSLSSTLDSFAASIREKRVLEGRIRSLTAQGKMQGIVLALLPAVMLLGIYLLDPDMVMPLFTTTIGQLLLVGA